MRRQKVRNLKEARAYQSSLVVVTTAASTTPTSNTPSPSPPESPYVPPAIPIRMAPAIDPLSLSLNSVLVTVQQQGATLNNIQQSEVRRASENEADRKQLQDSVSQIRATLQTTLLQTMQENTARLEREATERKRVQESITEAKVSMENRLLQVISDQQSAVDRENKLREERDTLLLQCNELNQRLEVARQNLSPAPTLSAAPLAGFFSETDSLQILFSTSSSSSSVSHTTMESDLHSLIAPIHEDIKVEDDWENVRSPGNTPASSPRRPLMRPTPNP